MTTYVGRRAKSPYERSVCVRLPSPLVDRIDTYAADEFCLRSTAIRKLLECGLAAENRSLRRDRPRTTTDQQLAANSF